MSIRGLIDRLANGENLTDDELREILLLDDDEYLCAKAAAVREKHYGKDVYLRGLIEISSYCKNDCRYCGIRRSNGKAERYRLSDEEILSCGDAGYDLGFRTFVLQGGEDPYFTDERLVPLVRTLKTRHPDCAVTLSLGERSRESYQKLFDAGADRYLLRHETADKAHYEMLHPAEMSYDRRMECLENLRETGYQVGCGMMVGSPYQTLEHLIKDLRFLGKFKPEMVGIGPFIPHSDTEYSDFEHGSAELVVRLISIIRLILPDALIPATTALGTVDGFGREKALLAGANVVMPNLSPKEVRSKYLLYDNKICTGEEAAECIRCMSLRVASVGYRTVKDRGDHVKYKTGTGI